MGIYVLEEDKTGPGTSAGGKTASSFSANKLANVPLRLWKSRNKSQSNTSLVSSSSWNAEGRCRWKSPTGQQVHLADVSLLELTDVERSALQQIALGRLQQMNLGCQLDLPKGENEMSHQKRRPLLLRRKAATTNFFDNKEKERDTRRSGLVFGLPLSQCIHNDRLAQQKTYNEERVHCEDRVPDNMNQISTEDEHNSRYRYLDPLEERMFNAPPSNRNFRDSSNYLHGRILHVPQVVDTCIHHLENKGMKTLGIFRVSGSKRRVRQLREDLDCGRKMAFGETSQPHDIAQLLKEYFRDLPEPLLPRELYQAFIASQRLQDPDRRLESFRLLLYLLPVPNRDTLAVLISFLSRVAQHATNYSSEGGKRMTGNKMDSSNLATVFGPNLLRLSQSSSERSYLVETLDTAQDRSDVILVIQSLIENHTTLFQVPSQDMDAVYKRLAIDDPEVLDILLNQRLHRIRSEYEDLTSETHCNENVPHLFEPTTTDSSNAEISQWPLQQGVQQCPISDADAKSHIRPLVLVTSECDDSDCSHLTTHAPESDRYLLAAPLYKASSVKDFLSDSCTVSASFTVTLADSATTTNVRDFRHLKIFETNKEETPKARQVRYGQHKHPTSPSFTVSEMREEMSITITIPSRRPTPKQQKVTEDSGSSSSFMFGNFFLWERGKVKAKSNNKSVQQCVKTKEHLQVKSSVSKHAQHSAAGPVLQERWKRQEIIASEHIQH